MGHILIIAVVALVAIGNIANACQDSHKNCATYQAKGYCQKTNFRQFMYVNCRKTCGFCSTTGGSGPCGSPRIAFWRGDVAAKGSWPWVASLTYNGNHKCGASLISDQWLLTSAKCVDRIGILGGWKIVLGSYDRTVLERNDEIHPIRQILKHPGYQGKRHINDIALIELQNIVTLTGKYIQKVCLPKQGGKPSSWAQCMHAGWGSLRGSTGHFSRLQQAHVGVAPSNRCANNPSIVCTRQASSTSRNQCNGDFGGPLFCVQNTKWIQYGIASFTTPNCREIAFTQVSKYVSWIRRHVPGV